MLVHAPACTVPDWALHIQDAAHGEELGSAGSGLSQPLDLHLQRVDSGNMIMFPDNAAGYVSQVHAAAAT